MTFSVSSFTPDSEVEQAVKARAEEAVAAAAAIHGLALDYSADSIRLVAQIFEQLHQSLASGRLAGDEMETAAERFGSYFGEVFRRSQGGTWGVGEMLGVRTAALRVPGETDHTLFPWNMARAGILDPGADGILDRYRSLVEPVQPPWMTGPPPDPAEIQELYRQATDPGRLYPVRSHKWYGFYAGQLPQGRQALVTGGNRRHELAVHLFDRDGNFLGVERRELNFDCFGDSGEDDDEEQEEDEDSPDGGEGGMAQTLRAYLAAEFGFRPGLIRIKRVDHPDAEFSIDPLPTHYEEFLEDPHNRLFTDEDRHAYPYSMREWLRQGEFIFNYNNDYYVDQNGEVTSS